MKTGHFIFIPTLMIWCLSVTPVHAQGNLIVNGSFENNGGGFNSWTLDNTAGYSYTLGGANVFGSGTRTTVPDGNVYAFFSGANGDGLLSQTLTTLPGAYYALSLSAVAFFGTNFANVSINGSQLAVLNFTSTVPVVLNVYSPFNTNWQCFNFIFQATSTNTTVAFTYAVQPQPVNYGAGGSDVYWGAGGLDAISVNSVPEPPPSFLILAGSVLFYIRDKYKRRSRGYAVNAKLVCVPKRFRGCW